MSVVGGGGGSGLGLSVSDDGDRDPVRRVHHRSVCDRECVSKLSTLVDSSRGLGVDLSRKGERSVD